MSNVLNNGFVSSNLKTHVQTFKLCFSIEEQTSVFLLSTHPIDRLKRTHWNKCTPPLNRSSTVTRGRTLRLACSVRSASGWASERTLWQPSSTFRLDARRVIGTCIRPWSYGLTGQPLCSNVSSEHWWT